MAASPARCGRHAEELDAPPRHGREPRRSLRAPGLRILVAEDNPVHRAYLLQILADLGHRTEAAVNGMEAVKLLSAVDFDLAFIDLRMPVLDGEDVLRSIRDGHVARVQPGMSVVAVTAQTDRGLRARMSAAGFDAIISKPLRRSDVLRVIEISGHVCPDAPAVDLEEAGSWLCNGDSGIFRRVLRIFLEQAKAFSSEASAALAEGNIGKVRFGSHSMANSAGMLRAERLRVAALSLEKSAQNGDMQAARAGLAQVERELAPILVAVRAYLNSAA